MVQGRSRRDNTNELYKIKITRTRHIIHAAKYINIIKTSINSRTIYTKRKIEIIQNNDYFFRSRRYISASAVCCAASVCEKRLFLYCSVINPIGKPKARSVEKARRDKARLRNWGAQGRAATFPPTKVHCVRYVFIFRKIIWTHIWSWLCIHFGSSGFNVAYQIKRDMYVFVYGILTFCKYNSLDNFVFLLRMNLLLFIIY